MSDVRGKTPKSESILKPQDKGFILDEYPLYNLNRTATTYIDEMSKAMKDIDSNITVWRILMLLDDQNPSTVGDLARKSVTKMSTVTRMLSRMEAEGMVQRECQVDDRRIILVSMTQKGKKTLVHLKSIGSLVYDRAVEGISEKEIRSMTRILKKIRANLNRSPYV